MTRIVGALEAMGLVSRLSDPLDRRVARVSLTGKGEAVLRRSRSAKNAYLAAQLRRLPPEDRRALSDLTVLLERLASLEEP
jgi:DNA-binding MarR family transcriptional regulator